MLWLNGPKSEYLLQYAVQSVTRMTALQNNSDFGGRQDIFALLLFLCTAIRNTIKKEFFYDKQS